ncbi:unnamed protein product [Acanthoscelides obtectus]|uniref:Uncharacterized protein n=1 Tax=Acanthoscelides obtectus TaxID=200917 RepID=A0A9P0LJ00_ACAOB|nr:unnamed protein product [Acanthoscelides obtectus]CAK1650272.1 hypothetical protein AOBTE_LOCUS16726 [Acanthoscelides obtectus]
MKPYKNDKANMFRLVDSESKLKNSNRALWSQNKST